MKPRYILAPEAARDLSQIWRYIKTQSSLELANHVESVIRGRFVFLAANPGTGHWRRDLASGVRFFPVYSYLIAYRSETSPLQIVAILHGRRDVEQILKERSSPS